MQGTKPVPTKGVDVQEKPPVDQSRRRPEFIAATTVIGTKLKGNDGSILGKIEEIMLDLTDGKVIYLVLSSGGVIGLGDKFLALPLDDLAFDQESKAYTMNIDKKTFKKQPGFDKNNWPREPQSLVKR